MLPLFQSLIAVLSAFAGAVLAASIAVSHRHLCALISFAAGTLLAMTLFHIIPDALPFLSLGAIGIALLSGYFLFYFISRHVSHVCPACAASHFEEHTAPELRSLALLMAIALSIHIVMDGIAIAVGRELGERTARALVMIISIHKFPEGLALCALLLKAGFPKKQCVFGTLFIEMLTLAGWMAGQLLLKSAVGSLLSYWLLVHIGGGFIYLGLHAVINESKEHSPRFILFFFLLGVAFVALTRFLPI